MSYPQWTPARRPAVVTAAVAVLALMALAALAYAAAGLVTRGGTVDRFRTAAAGISARQDHTDRVVTLLGAATVLTAVVSLLAGLLLVALALGLRAGRDGARTATWVVSGLGLIAGCCALTLVVGQRALPLRPDENDRATAELVDLLAGSYPSWWIPLGTGLSVGQVLGYLVVAVLLALPAARGWFRRRPEPPLPQRPPASPLHPHQPPAPPYPPR
ncbi:hypothetical protein [Micromonospora sp. KLBMP9576]|uniref:hypothetical protein n=1 Tax=Micromonospora sp. KLBMP9576 TaxID=3424769 RepID=UPI003D8A2A4A